MVNYSGLQSNLIHPVSLVKKWINKILWIYILIYIFYSQNVLPSTHIPSKNLEHSWEWGGLPVFSFLSLDTSVVCCVSCTKCYVSYVAYYTSQYQASHVDYHVSWLMSSVVCFMCVTYCVQRMCPLCCVPSISYAMCKYHLCYVWWVWVYICILHTKNNIQMGLKENN